MRYDRRMPDASERLPLWRRFPAAHQFLRARLMDELAPRALAVDVWVEDGGADTWLVSLCCPEPPFTRSERFSADELRQVYGRWAQWARGCARDLAELLPN
jgi:hypothetical protein